VNVREFREYFGFIKYNVIWYISAVMQTPTPHAITTITVSTSGQQDGTKEAWWQFHVCY
jgi:hypothetical protein